MPAHLITGSLLSKLICGISMFSPSIPPIGGIRSEVIMFLSFTPSLLGLVFYVWNNYKEVEGEDYLKLTNTAGTLTKKFISENIKLEPHNYYFFLPLPSLHPKVAKNTLFTALWIEVFFFLFYLIMLQRIWKPYSNYLLASVQTRQRTMYMYILPDLSQYTDKLPSSQ